MVEREQFTGRAPRARACAGGGAARPLDLPARENKICTRTLTNGDGNTKAVSNMNVGEGGGGEGGGRGQPNTRPGPNADALVAPG